MMYQPKPPFLFIVGSARSGTTLLRSIFNAHPDLAVSHEAHFVGDLARRRWQFERSGRFEVEPFLSAIYRDDKFLLLELELDELKASLHSDPVDGYPDAVRRIFSLYAARQGKSRYGDKTPGYVLRMPELAELFPESLFIHIIRDGRDVALSLLELLFKDRMGLGETAHFWRRRVAIGRREGRLLGDDRYREVRYEDLVQDPEAVMRSLCAFARLDFDPRMLTYFERDDRFVRSDRFPGLHARLALPPTKGMRDWRREMSAADVALFEAIAGRLLDELGYERLAGESIRAKVAARWNWTRWQTRRIRFHAPRIARRSIKRFQPTHRSVRDDLPAV